MEKTCINYGRGKDTYRVTGDFHGLTYQEIADKCDCGNWGYNVRLTLPDEIIIEVYTD
jgi:hypothetical protein